MGEVIPVLNNTVIIKNAIISDMKEEVIKKPQKTIFSAFEAIKCIDITIYVRIVLNKLTGTEYVKFNMLFRAIEMQSNT